MRQRDTDNPIGQRDRLKDLLFEALPFVRDAGSDEDPEAQRRARDLIRRIHQAVD